MLSLIVKVVVSPANKNISPLVIDSARSFRNIENNLGHPKPERLVSDLYPEI